MLPGTLFFFYLLSAPIKLVPQIGLFDVKAGLVVFGGSCFSVKTNRQEEKTFCRLFYPVFAGYDRKMAAEL
jgi:hypothetical protein